MKKLFVLLSIAFFQIGAMAQPCSELFFSEYTEGASGFNKAIEIYNPSSSAIDLSNYSIWLFTNGNTTKNFNSIDTLPSILINAGATYVIGHTQSGAGISNVSDTLIDVVNFNGNDALVLFNKATGDTADIIGVVGEDPGDEWMVDGGNGSTKDNTLVRKASVQEGSTDWNVVQNQWNVFADNNHSNLGSHTMNSCGPITDTLVSFATSQRTVNENQSPVNITLNLNAFSSNSNLMVDVVLESGDTSNISGYTGETVDFNSTSEQILITLSFDSITAPESFVFKLRNPTGNLQLSPDSSFTLTVVPIVSLPSYTIATVRGNNTDGLPDSLGVECQLSGTVIGPNFNASGLQFSFNDGTGGMGAFVPGSIGNFGYTVNEGDSIVAIGTIGHFNGWAQMEFLDTIYLAGTGRNITPQVVTELNESTESELVKLNNVQITGIASCTGAGTTYEATSGGFAFTIRIDSDVISAAQDPIDNGSITQLLSVTGVGGQFKFNPPYNSDYQITPRNVGDLEIDPNISVAELHEDISNIYPNPAQNSIQINLKNNINAEQVNIFSISGKNVSRKVNTNINSGSIFLDISALENGSYFAQIQSKDKTIQAKFIIAK